MFQVVVHPAGPQRYLLVIILITKAGRHLLRPVLTAGKFVLYLKSDLDARVSALRLEMIKSDCVAVLLLQCEQELTFVDSSVTMDAQAALCRAAIQYVRK